MVNRKIKNATECSVDGIKFRSLLERSVYNYLKSINITVQYEPTKFTIWDKDKFIVPYYDRYGKTFKRIIRKPTAVHYTPDFIFTINNTTVYLEVKGFKNDVTPYKIRLFRDTLDTIANETKASLCYAVVYSLRDLKTLLKELNGETS